ncbi:succinate dehydrogenase, hydrophobic membrane anchor protein [Phaeobacter sp. QD34_3]|uniref:succinate dehydrogenase, hydrophobic membrane anchor protein n=1 Tax=unclassified Phaeobacter TaxID=2621772 RepID=UPI00237F744E|nr:MULTISPECIES: succinate dehydrogenase, hydrophobic membrane anchor protein [unclassified Phaeobacter]MDE4132881.1 succinate dehydrogenase, hydrophobic membrane anchor protein [Phaeobacter sp. QD34_3]MDE4136326.1 succinate dehydrogenase, hydrophobic membrane anchor protein [Phaeobacter sp. QD34_24]MDE4174751.1 succinate dehydrogenase, hydrophobic membrane anchor protein [Phaeobacter sp. PT47_59]
MRYLTDRKRAQGLGSGGSGTQQHWQMMVRSIIMVVLVPLFVITFGMGLGGSYEEVLAYFSRPFPAIVMGLALVVGIYHLMCEAQEAIEDYVHGTKGKLTLVAVKAFAFTLIAASLFALVKLAL